MRLIDADALKRHYGWWGDTESGKERRELFDDIIDQQPTVAPMKTTKIKKLGELNLGTTFRYGGERFVILDNLETGVLVLLEQSSKSVPFNPKGGDDDSPKNNYAHSTLREEIEGPWLESLIEHGAKREDMVEFTVDLRPTDMSDGYGVLSVLAAPLTLWQYGKYKDIIPMNENDWWWLVTPWSCQWLRSPCANYATGAWFVYTNGSYGVDDCSSSFGVRPALVLNSELVVSLDDA